jgi:hypothetical protein
MNNEDMDKLQFRFHIILLEVITVLNQEGMNYEGIENCVKNSFKECIETYDNNRNLLTKVIKKIKDEGIIHE